MATKMKKLSCYVVFDKHGPTEFTKREPAVGPDEGFFQLNIRVPADFFDKKVPVVNVVFDEVEGDDEEE